jgi:CBS domain containing-hemolysin-like protein
METILIIVAISLTGSFLCSLFEASLYSITPTRTEALRRKGMWGGARLAKLRHGVEEPIAAILTVNTIANTMGAIWAGALVGEIYGHTWVTWFAIAFTISVLFFTEIVPKTIGVVHASTLGPLVAWPIQAMIWLVWPLAKLSVKLTRRLSRGKKPAGPTEDEILVMSDLALQAGKLLPEEQVWIHSALRLDQVTVHELMTPRTVVEWLKADLRLGELRSRTLLHSRLPLVEGDDLLQVVGLVHRRDIFDALVRGDDDRRLRDFLRPVHFVPETTPANQLLRQFLARREHLAVVVDEHGDIRGLVTLEDVLEHLLGQEIVDEYDQHPDMQEAARRKARRRLRPS